MNLRLLVEATKNLGTLCQPERVYDISIASKLNNVLNSLYQWREESSYPNSILRDVYWQHTKHAKSVTERHNSHTAQQKG